MFWLNSTYFSLNYFIKYVPSLWLPSFNPNYGPDYWPLTVCDGETDSDVLNNAIAKLSENHPELSVVYFADVDHYGHSGIWSDYTGAIETADKAVGQLWEFVQSDSFYKDSTILIVTNDHGRHDDDHGGFRGHGCSCNGCRQIMFLAIGKGIKQNYISEIEYKLTDVAVTIASVLDVDAEHATGEEITDIFETTNICTSEAEALYKMYGSMMKFTRDVNESVTVNIIDMNGIIRHSYHLSSVSEGQELQWNNGNLSLGIYLITINSVSGNQIKKVIVN